MRLDINITNVNARSPLLLATAVDMHAQVESYLQSSRRGAVFGVPPRRSYSHFLGLEVRHITPKTRTQGKVPLLRKKKRSTNDPTPEQRMSPLLCSGICYAKAAKAPKRI